LRLPDFTARKRDRGRCELARRFFEFSDAFEPRPALMAVAFFNGFHGKVLADDHQSGSVLERTGKANAAL
jgi:hypothetical protein